MTGPVRRALVTGGSRGVGAAVCRLLGRAGLDVVVGFRDKQVRARRVAAAVETAGGLARVVAADLSGRAGRDLLLADAGLAGGLDVVVLCASGGLEPHADPGYADRLNAEGQAALVSALLPQLRPGARVVFLTSHQAHFVREVAVEPDYAPVAWSKRAGEDRLEALRPDLSSRGADLVVVSADLLEDSTTTLLFERSDPGSTARRRSQIGSLPTTASFAEAVVHAALAPSWPGPLVLHGGAAWFGSRRDGAANHPHERREAVR